MKDLDNLNELDEVLEELSTIEKDNEVLLTEDTIYRNSRDNIYIALTPDEGRNFIDNAYFKISWKPINRSNSYVARINMRTGDYEIHNNFSIDLTKSIVKDINNILHNPNAIYDIENKYNIGTTVWDSMLVYLSIKFKDSKFSDGTSITIDNLRIKYPAIYINPDPNKLKNHKTCKWGGK